MVSYPPDAAVLVDAAAMLRSNCVAKRSPMDVAGSLYKKLVTLRPWLCEVFFDKADSTSYPPQRAEVAAARAAVGGSGVTIETICGLMAKYRCKRVDDLGTTDVNHLPYLTDRTIDWAALFSRPATKRLAWNLLGTALHYTMRINAATVDPTNCFATRIYLPDGETVLTTNPTDEVLPDECRNPYGEGDLQCFNAARIYNTAGRSTIIASIDTDFILILAASCFCPQQPFVIDLKSGALCGRALSMLVGGYDREVRLNACFWLISHGGDYSVPFTRLGFYTKSLLELFEAALASKTAGERLSRVITQKADSDVWEFHPQRVMKQLHTTKQRKRNNAQVIAHPPHKCMARTLFSLLYYGFAFDPLGPPYPPEPPIDSRQATFEFKLHAL
jgi:hypothetical protein